MQTARKNVRNLLITAVWIALVLPASIAVLLLLPNWLSVGIIFFIAKFHVEIGTVALGVCIAFAMYKLYRFVKLTENPWQTARVNVRNNLIFLLFIPFVIYAFMVLFAFIFHKDYSRCDYYNEQLNGGVKEFNGQKFNIHMCGTGGDDIQSNDKVRLQIFNEKGNLVALRHFIVNWNEGSAPKVLEYHPDHITYFDDSDEDSYKKTLTMAPTALDWIRARIPLLD